MMPTVFGFARGSALLLFFNRIVDAAPIVLIRLFDKVKAESVD